MNSSTVSHLYAFMICGYLSSTAIFFFVVTESFFFPSTIVQEYEILPQSNLEIKGKTNVNSFCCSSKQRFAKETLHYQWQKSSSKLLFEDANLVIPIKTLDCGARGINKDMRATLRAEEYPEIKMKLREVILPGNEGPQRPNDWKSSTLIASLTIISTTNQIIIPVHYVEIEKGSLQIIGEVRMDWCDYGMEAPTALLGLIKVADTIEISFDLKVKLY